MRLIGLLAALLVSLSAAGCTHQYSVKLDGDVNGSDKDTPRVVKADVHEGSEARATREAARGHLHPLTDAKVTVALKFRKEDKPKGSQTVKVDTGNASFHFEASGESDQGTLSGVTVHVEAPGRQPIERIFPSPPDVPFEAVLMAVLDEAGASSSPTAPSVGSPASAPADPSKTTPPPGK